jgi:prepilin-type N-terminal cleavage/methylation domain-containing protein
VQPSPGLRTGFADPSATRLSGARGFTLIELTIVLGVIVTLALVLTPSIANYLTDARASRARNDARTIASAIVQFNRDTGFYPLWTQSQNGGAGTTANRVDLLVSRGNIPGTAQSSLWTTGTSFGLTEALVYNTPAYTVRTATSTLGWNGPYLSSVIEADAWGNRYAVNVGLLDSTSGGLTAAGTPKSAVWVLSAGANGSLETSYTQPATTAVVGGDDIGFRIQ